VVVEVVLLKAAWLDNLCEEVWEIEVSKERSIQWLVKKKNFTVTQAEERYQAVLVDPEMRRERVHLFISNKNTSIKTNQTTKKKKR